MKQIKKMKNVIYVIASTLYKKEIFHSRIREIFIIHIQKE